MLRSTANRITNYQHEKIGFNYRMSNICAGIGRGQMTVANDHIAHHKHVQALYEELLKDVPGIKVHGNPDSRYDSNFWLCTITIDPEVRIKGQENAYKTIVTGAVGGAAGVIHAAESAHTDCEPNDNVEALRVIMDQALENIPYKRDKKDCTYLDNIKDFMDSIRTGKTVIVVFSRAYLKSKSCMYELSGIMEDTEYFKKILPVVIDDEIRQGEFYLNLVKYWEEEKKKQQEEVDRFDGLDSMYVEPIKEKLDEIVEICKLLPELKRYIDWTNAENLNYMCATKFNSIIRKIRERYIIKECMPKNQAPS